MKLFITIIEIVLYIGVLVILSLGLFKKFHLKLHHRIYYLLIGVNFVLSMPLFSIIDYKFQLNVPLIEAFAVIGFIESYFLMISILLLCLYLLFQLIFNKISRKYKLSLKDFKTRTITLCLISSISICSCISGYIGSINYKVEEEKIDTNLNGLKIAVLADIHYGTTCSTLIKEKLVNNVNNTHPDIIFFVGDIFDNHIEDMDKEDFTNFMDSFKATYGSYAVLGNHELKQNSYEDAITFYSDCKNVKLLLDEEVNIDNKIRVLGRIDATYKNRKPLKDIVSTSSLPLIVLDHQPDEAMEAKSIGAAIQYSGHTHNGQIFPYNIAVSLYYSLFKHLPINGTNKFDDFYLIITRGASNWGFPYKNTGSSQIIINTGK